jgi:hypothetical protein
MMLINGLEIIHLVICIHNSKGSESGKSFITFITRNTLRECPLMGYNFRVGRVVLNDPLKLVLIDLKLSDIVGRVVENYWTHFMDIPLGRHLGLR